LGVRAAAKHHWAAIADLLVSEQSEQRPSVIANAG
jgi:hypothetical protein